MLCAENLLGSIDNLFKVVDYLKVKHNAMKAYGGVEVKIHIFLISALVGGEWSASRPCLFTPEIDPRCPLDRMLGGPQNRSG
jgi:hypothetical protein